MDPEQLQNAYNEIVDKAKEVNLAPITGDADLIFQSELSVLGTAEDDLVCMIHIPSVQWRINEPFSIMYRRHSYCKMD